MFIQYKVVVNVFFVYLQLVLLIYFNLQVVYNFGWIFFQIIVEMIKLKRKYKGMYRVLSDLKLVEMFFGVIEKVLWEINVLCLKRWNGFFKRKSVWE